MVFSYEKVFQKHFCRLRYLVYVGIMSARRVAAMVNTTNITGSVALAVPTGQGYDVSGGGDAA
jgi:pantoate kinase